MQYVLVIFTLGFLVLLHELGHFLAAKWCGMPVACLSIGFGPKLWSHKIGETEYRLSLIPLGGYVLPAFKSKEDFWGLGIRRRMLFSLGGPLANLVISVLLFAVLNVWASGISLANVTVKPVVQTVLMTGDFFKAIPQLFAQPGQLSGIVGTVVEGGEMVGNNLLNLLLFAIIINLNLLVFNLLPIPALDGGKLLLYLLEIVHPKSIRWHIPLSIAGWLLMLGLMLYATVLDVGRYFV